MCSKYLLFININLLFRLSLFIKLKRFSIIFLQVVVVLLGIGALFLLLWEPHMEGRNLHATPFEIYFKDPFLLYAYTASVSFFVGLFQVFRLFGHIGKNRIFTQNAVKALRTIKYCAIVIIAFALGAEAYFITVQAGKGEDIAGGLAMGCLIIFISVIVAVAASLFEKILHNAVDIKSENDLTIKAMPIVVNLDVMMAKRKMSLNELSDRVDLTLSNLSILKTGKAKAIRFTTLDAICKALDCQPGDILEYVYGDQKTTSR